MFVGAEIRGSLDNGPSLGWTSHYRALLTHFEVAPNVFINKTTTMKTTTTKTKTTKTTTKTTKTSHYAHY